MKDRVAATVAVTTMVGAVAVATSALATAAVGAPVDTPLAAHAQEAGVVEIPLRLQDGRLVVAVRAADGSELDFIVSTGTAVTVLSATGAARIGEGGLTLGGMPVPLEGREVVPDDGLGSGAAVYGGMIGSNTLNRYDVLVDLPGGRLLLKPVGPEVAWAGMTLSDPVRLRVFHGVVLSLDVELEGRPYPAMLELGAPRILVNQRVIDETGVEGTGTLRVAGATAPDVPVALSDHPVIERFSPNGDGFVLVGTPLVVGCAVSISWVHQELRTCVR
jgi:hypothetical protein